jgi:DNA polymerase-3 subunit epsilon
MLPDHDHPDPVAPDRKPWWPGPLLGFDTETTGVDVETDRIVTAAVVRRDAQGQQEVRTWLIDPGVEIPASASAIHGVTTQQARADGVAPPVGLGEIADALVSALRERVPVVAFNAAFDLRLLDVELARHGLATLPERLGHPVRPVLDPLVIDRAKQRYRKGPRTLGDLCVAYQVQQTGDLHSADVDVIATLDMLEKMLAQFPDLPATALLTLHEAQRTWHRTWTERRRAYHAARGAH